VEGKKMVQTARILIVDDDENISGTLALVLEQDGYIVDVAKSGKEAIEKTERSFYNLAIVDWRLPDIEGTKLLNQLHETVPKMAKVMLTGYPSMNNAVAAVNNRADAFFMKPVDFNLFFEKIRQLLKEQEEALKFNEERVTKFIETRSKEILQNSSIKLSKD
jgi:DNA-binding NtrC family response regulator